ncbi:MAG TPA: aminotransferase class I/II-fold pyridoxal phosphate-dependent enzyme [Candidatus Woesebacteria bacterium]|nr:aminotransferase class I/II-fold pyridoxal phosphate-dependent enzyme [Candidatus Woesebacteria bacterium]HNS95224.1 aminotransferase class I/II-fold pyridoxal phosphate-dependent enzyme [Candidatus Woesebacteria bacterium]
MPVLSARYHHIEPSAIRQAQIAFESRTDGVKAINVAVGNVSLPMHPAMQKRMCNLTSSESPFADGIVRYTPTVGTPEANDAMKRVLEASGVDTTALFTHITSGGSEAMELIILGVCDKNRPLLVIDPIYSNYHTMASRVGVPVVAVPRELGSDGTFTRLNVDAVEALISTHRPGALLIIPYDNPTGTMLDQGTIDSLAALCVRHDIWMVSDEAYRELHYGAQKLASVWRIDTAKVPGIEGKRVSIESVSKVWNACGLRIGAMVTDNELLHTQTVAEHTVTLCASAIGQYIFGAIAHENVEKLHEWFAIQRTYYETMSRALVQGLQTSEPRLIVTAPESSLYCVVDVRALVPESFEAHDFCVFCAQKGGCEIEGEMFTLLLSPMSGFYTQSNYAKDPGRSQIRIAYVQDASTMQKVPKILMSLLHDYLARVRS